MEVLKFTLSGKTAFFKKPDVNTYVYYTYGNIHKVALLGIFGAVLGYGGYANQGTDLFPEFYQKLCGLQVSIVPICENGFIPKKLQLFNNAVGYANTDAGILNVREQWLENPCWDIYISLNHDEAKKLAKKVLDRKCTYIPYLGTNDHIADISNAEVCQVQEAADYHVLHSLFLTKKASFGDREDYEEEYAAVTEYKYEDFLPIGLDEALNHYIKKAFAHTNMVIAHYEDTVYRAGNQNIVFY